MSGRVAVVTGANRGLGYHIAMQIIASGLFETVILACRLRGCSAIQWNSPVLLQMKATMFLTGDCVSRLDCREQSEMLSAFQSWG